MGHEHCCNTENCTSQWEHPSVPQVLKSCRMMCAVYLQWSASASSLLLSCDVNVTHQLVVAAADSGHYHVWDVRSGQKVTTIKGSSYTEIYFGPLRHMS